MGSPTIAGVTTGTVDEDFTGTVSGDLGDAGTFSTDGDDTWSITVQGQYGVATIDANGTWTYDLDETNPAVMALDDGETLTDIFTVQMFDTAGSGQGQSDTQDITITINGVPCFTRGTRIRTTDGEMPVQKIRTGQLVMTPSGPRPVAWVGSRRVGKAELAADPRLRPVRIAAGALGEGIPRRDLLVSRQHRMVVRSRIAERMFGETEVLVAAAALLGLPGISVDESAKTVEYFHLLFDRHEIVFADGAPSESLYTGPRALHSLPVAAREEILTLMPDLARSDDLPDPARQIPEAALRKELLERHRKHDRAIVAADELA